MNYFVKNYEKIKYPKDFENNGTGLRNAQIGAIHSVGSFFSIGTKKARIITMPTGSGKTAVIMIAPFVLESKKVLIVTPNALVRNQIYGHSSFSVGK